MRLAGGFLSTFGAALVIQVAGITTGLLSARLLGPQGKGELTALLLWPGILTTIGSLGLFDAMVYFAGREAERTRAVLATGLTLVLGLAIAVVTIGVLVLPLVLSNYDVSVVDAGRLYLVLYTPISLAALSVIVILQGTAQFGSYNALRALVHVGYAIGIVGLWLVGRTSVSSVAAASLVANLATLLVAFVIAYRNGWFARSADRVLAKEMLSYGLKSHVGTTSSLLNVRMDQMLMSALLPPTHLGLYAAAVTYASTTNLIAGSLATLAFPSLVHAGSFDQRRDALGRFVRFNSLLSALVVLGLFLGAPLLVPTLFGEAFREATLPAMVLLVAALPLNCNLMISVGFKAFGLPAVSSKAEIVGLMVTFPLLLLLLPHFQALGAAVASLFAYLASYLYLGWSASKEMQLAIPDMFFIKVADLRRAGDILRTLPRMALAKVGLGVQAGR